VKERKEETGDGIYRPGEKKRRREGKNLPAVKSREKMYLHWFKKQKRGWGAAVDLIFAKKKKEKGGVCFCRK